MTRAVHTCGGRTVRGARARVRCVRGRARTICTRGARARCTYAPRARTVRTVREPYARTVRKKCALKSAVFHSKSAVFFQTSKSAVFFCTYGPRVRCPYGTARAGARRVRMCDARARAKTARARTVRARCTYRMANRTRGLYGKSVCQISLCCFQNLMHVFLFQNLLRFFSNLRCSFRTYGRGRTVWHARVRCARRAARTRARVRCTAHARGVRVRSAQCACMARVRLMSVAQPSGHWVCFAFSVTRNTHTH